MVELPELTPEQEMELCRRIADRGDLQLLGLPVATLGEVYKIVQEWRIKGYSDDAIERLVEQMRIRSALDSLVDAKEVAHIVVAEAIRLLKEGHVEAAIETLRVLLEELRAE